ncbi:hypothetical protein C4K38_0303 [Pseudomonas chlororaphis subsp. piscium]|uniref:hypothetical protein n=1 Tax=Pseudomonas chlororaphis TaxID=587753 RepID=UPI0006A5E5B0|nr:hypothetical protein [Pseudomonas chlororaphis]AZC28294.1 hypothetical protein C4K38_0303 [Pseudomonas chlororaphis subsp. piscium]QTT91509.1 hypothetical protein HUT28_30245 [Pseudomonas chlororaphis]WDG92324.1 hypothetical protein PUP49_02610 [Pseudomonas chlororaphis]SDR89255.1 hypothetical protein SAMN05216585_0569 [Pseudomonas chlororaphis]
MDRYLALKSNFTDGPVLFIDSQANQQDIYICAQQRLRAAADLLETLTCLSFHQADTKDTAHIINALYLLVQDGCDLLETAQFRV